MANWLISREQVKRAGGLSGSSLNARIDNIIEGVSTSLENELHRKFLSRIETRLYPWPPKDTGPRWELKLDQWLISVTTLQTMAQNTTPTTIVAADYFLEPVNLGPPYTRIEIDLSSTAAFESGDTPQRSISVLGSWGYNNATKSAGTVASGLASDAAATSMVLSDATLVDVGDTILIESEQLFVTERTNATSGATLSSSKSALQSETTIDVNDGTAFNVNEVILIDSERMEITSITSNNLTVLRAVDGSTLAAHDSGKAVHVFRTLTVERANNGTTAATHANSTAITKYLIPFDVQSVARGLAIAQFHQENSGYARTIGTGDGAVELQGIDLGSKHKALIKAYRGLRLGDI